VPSRRSSRIGPTPAHSSGAGVGAPPRPAESWWTLEAAPAIASQSHPVRLCIGSSADTCHVAAGVENSPASEFCVRWRIGFLVAPTLRRGSSGVISGL